ncbi:MAG: NAD(P)/FAD-dependent oxidoreductase, partial [Daejeonella sp.]|nr:NAD(P)/FAD-dependent oxidoreductase [Daejeonella sp.]
FESFGILGSEKTLGQLFPISNNAKDIVHVFENLCSEMNQPIICDATVTNVLKVDDGFKVTYDKNGKLKEVLAQKVVVAAGGLPIPKMGATDFGLKVARQFGLKITETVPALVPLTITGKDADWYSKLSGNSIFCRVFNDQISFEENILFTHWGLSGPAILQISSYWKPGELIYIDLLPNKSIVDLIANERIQRGKQLLLNFLGAIFTRKFAEALADYLPVEKTIGSLSKSDLENIQQFIHQFKVKPAGTKGYDKAEVMLGGVSTSELSSKTLESKKVKGLYFGGECVDVTGWLGGYNFQWAWASGFVIAQNI